MEVRLWALQILTSESLADKLYFPEILTDQNPGLPLIINEPARSSQLSLQKRKKCEKLPSLNELSCSEKRAICLHRFAGHELLAVEIMAYALLAFPKAPSSFRKGLVYTLKEEQMHVKLYCQRLKDLRVEFGSLPLYKHFWNHTPYITSPLHYVSIMPLTFEMANLDFAPLYGKQFLKWGDIASSELMATILKDEISHVRFGLRWLKQFKPASVDDWEAWENTLKTTLLHPKRAKGFQVNVEMREKVGLERSWIEKLKEAKGEKRLFLLN